MKVIFLDIDGVLNCRTCLSRPEAPSSRDVIDRDHVVHLNTIIDRTGAVVVISSTWRILDSMEKIDGLLREAGFVGEIVGKTPVGGLGPYRGNEIQAWLNGEKKVDAFVILDDDSDMMHLMSHLVQTSMEHGLQSKHVDLAVEVLKR